MNMPRIAVLGSLNMDLVAVAPRIPRPGETVIGERFFRAAGGKGANQAYAAASLGGKVAMLGRVGRDDHGSQIIASLKAVGCDVTRIEYADTTTGVGAILVDQTGQNSIIVVPGANSRFLPQDLLRDQALLQDARLLLLQLEIPLDTVIAAAKAARRSGATVILDPAPAPTSLPSELLEHVDILTPNETEACRLLGRSASELNRQEAPAVASQLLKTGARTVILKLGAMGCLAADGTTITWIEAPKVNAVDSTAAGDVFNGALAVASSEGASLIEACRFAVRAAAISVTRYGAQPSMPTRAELEAL
jgi:ribokinase